MTSNWDESRVGTIVEGRYKLLSVLGAGAFGTVYKAQQLATEQLVALKVLQVDLDVADQAETAIARFDREMKLMGRISHPNIVRLVDSGRFPDGTIYIAMEYVRGDSLADVVERHGPIPIRQTCRLMLQVLEALGRAHSEGVVHRDLKPQNIMVSDLGPRCNAMVLDFGISFVVEEAREEDYRTLTARNEVAGTPAYMAPEQLVDSVVTPAADLYAWGLVFMETLTARPAFEVRSLVKLIMRHTKGEPVEIPELLMSSPLGPILARATAFDVSERYPNVDEPFEALDVLDLRGPWVKPLQEQLDAQAPHLEGASDAEVCWSSDATTIAHPPAGKSAPNSSPQTPSPQAVAGAPGSGPARAKLLTAAIFALAAVCAIAAVLLLTRSGSDGADDDAASATPTTDSASTEDTIQFAQVAMDHVPEGADEMVPVAAGVFIMGCQSTDDPACDPDEHPTHSVELDGYEIDVTEVTVAAFARCVDAGVCEEPGSFDQGRQPRCNWGRDDRFDHPVNCVSWYQAQIYCDWVGKRLPTEAEWARAARGNGGREYPWGDTPPDCDIVAMSADTDECTMTSTWPVGSAPQNISPVGALDMSGNVWEWTADWYDRTYYTRSSTRNPTGPPGGEERVIRGGGFDDDAEDMRISQRSSDRPWELDDDTGLRCARSMAAER